MHDFKELLVWKKSRILVKSVYLIVKDFPQTEKYGLKSQIQRAAVSIPSNIAEGAGRYTKKNFAYFLNIALGSSYELETQIILATDLNLIETVKSKILQKNISEVQKMLYGLIKQLRT